MAPTALLRILRRGVALLLALAALLTALFALMALGSGSTVNETIAHSRAIQDRFLAAHQSVENFRQQNQRFPDQEELAALEAGRFASIRILKPGDFGMATFYEDAGDRLGAPAQGSYVLSFWRGEWTEYYAAWSGRSTLVFDPAAYYATGSRFLDFLAGVFIACLLGIATWRLWPRRR